MRSAEIRVDGQKWVVQHHGDFSGDIYLTLVAEDGSDLILADVKVPFEVLEEIVGRKWMLDYFGRLEQFTGREFLKELMD